ncbi:winged helix-turn-helix transcriptional regulator [Fodinicola feengrottensis]|uniref:winged helix-turn-helix transcriptional regulator n=1 Tax=Fodinicola feengrottensis TaxID=435914 RepID=UPI0013D7FDE2|nr:helix-turn-helix domain-containing protein [Fodinicola feengrottensis]
MTTHCNPYDQLVADCQLRAATDLFSHRWDPVVLVALQLGPLRRGDVLTTIGGISDKMLTETLRRLTGNGLVERQTYAQARARAEYSLTPLGRSLVEGPMRALGKWILEHGEEMLDAQERVL